jgi:hypothetical protein
VFQLEDTVLDFLLQNFAESEKEHNSSSQSVPGKRMNTSFERRSEFFSQDFHAQDISVKLDGLPHVRVTKAGGKVFLSYLIIKLDNGLVVIQLFFYDTDQLNKTSLCFGLKP